MSDLLARRRILLVEDEMLVSWLLVEMLEDLGCIVVGPAARLDRALQLAADETIDAGVLDLNLNGERSYGVADQLSARNIPFIFSTGYSGDRLLRGYGTFAILQKPYQKQDLGAALTLLFSDPPAAD